MITDALLLLVNILVNWLIVVRPEWDMSIDNENQQIHWAFTWIHGLDPYLPVTETFVCLAAMITLVVALQGWKWVVKLVDWIADVIP